MFKPGIICYSEGTSQIIAFYSEANRNDNFQVNADVTYRHRIAQSFTPTSNTTLTSAKFFILRSEGVITGNVYAKLYSHNGTYGTSGVPNTLLATSDVRDASTFTNAGYTLESFSFTGVQQYAMTSGDHYFISIEYEGIDAVNYFRVGIDTSGGYEGNIAYYISNWSYETYNAIFYIYGIV